MRVHNLHELVLYNVTYDNERLIGLKKDIKTLLQCNNVEDLNNAEWEVHKLNKSINRIMKDTDRSFDDIVDEFVESLVHEIKSLKTDVLKKEEKLENGKKWISTLTNSLESNGYKVIRADEESLIVEGNGNNQDDCVAFVDTVVSIIKGKYHGTGKGGSWTTWEVMSEDNIPFRVECDRNNNFKIEIC